MTPSFPSQYTWFLFSVFYSTTALETIYSNNHFAVSPVIRLPSITNFTVFSDHSEMFVFGLCNHLYNAALQVKYIYLQPQQQHNSWSTSLLFSPFTSELKVVAGKNYKQAFILYHICPGHCLIALWALFNCQLSRDKDSNHSRCVCVYFKMRRR